MSDENKSPENQSAPAKESLGHHFISKGRCFRVGNKLVTEGYMEKDKDGKDKSVPMTLVAARAGQRFEAHQLEGIENVSEVFTKVNYVAE